MGRPENPSYQRPEPLVVTEKVRRQIAGAFAELDMEQLAIIRQMTPAERVQRAASMIEAVETVSAYRLRQREPHLSEAEALWIVRRGLVEYELNKRKQSSQSK